TLLNLISALDRPDTGEILVAGANVTGLSLVSAAKYRNRQVGIIFQSYNLLPQLTALENVLAPNDPKRANGSRPCARTPRCCRPCRSTRAQAGTVERW